MNGIWIAVNVNHITTAILLKKVDGNWIAMDTANKSKLAILLKIANDLWIAVDIVTYSAGVAVLPKVVNDVFYCSGKC